MGGLGSSLKAIQNGGEEDLTHKSTGAHQSKTHDKTTTHHSSATSAHHAPATSTHHKESVPSTHHKLPVASSHHNKHTGGMKKHHDRRAMVAAH
jgi:hypothetical protein